MWATTNKFGIVPDSRGGLLQLGFFSDFNTQKKIRLAYGISGVGYFTQAKNKAILDELYMSAKWEKIRLDMGMIHPDIDFTESRPKTETSCIPTTVVRNRVNNLRTDYIRIPADR